MMKKLMTMLLSLLLVLACVVGAEAADFTGEWVLAEVSKGGVTVDMVMMGLSAGMQINADGTSVLTMMDEPENGTWTLSDNGIVVTDASGVAANFVWNGETLATELKGLTLAFVPAEKEAAEEEASGYTGEWVLTGAEMNSVKVDMEALGLKANMVLNADGTCVLTMMNESQNATWVETETGISTTDAQGVVDTYTLTEDKLVAEQAGIKLIFSKMAGEAAAEEVPAEAVTFVGDWQVTRAKAFGIEYDPTTIGLFFTMHIYEDGTAKLLTGESEEMCTWAEAEGGVAVTDASGETLVFTAANGELSAEQDGVLLVFTPMVAAPAEEAPAAETPAAAAEAEQAEYASPMANLTLADFAGEWSFVYAEYKGQVLAPEDAGMTAELSIAGEQGRMEINTDAGSVVYEARLVPEEVADVGTVVYFVWSETDPVSGETSEYYLLLLMYDNGELVWCDSDGQGNDIFYCFEMTGLGEETAE